MAGPHPNDLPLTQARALVQRAVDKAAQLGLRGGIAVVGASGALITASRLDHGGPGGMARARSKAWISATQQIPSTEHLHRMTTIAGPVAAGFAAVSPEAVFPGAGGMPITRDGVVVAGPPIVLAARGARPPPRSRAGGLQPDAGDAVSFEPAQRAVGCPTALVNPLNRSELSTTKTDENAIAAPAIIGFSRPVAASGIAATL